MPTVTQQISTKERMIKRLEGKIAEIKGEIEEIKKANGGVDPYKEWRDSKGTKPELLDNRNVEWPSPRLSITGYPDMTRLPEGLDGLWNGMTIRRCKALETLPSRIKITGNFAVLDCKALKKIPSLRTAWGQWCAPVNSIKIWNCPQLQKLPGTIRSFRSLRIGKCPSLKKICSQIHIGVPSHYRQCANDVGVYIEDCPSLTKICRKLVVSWEENFTLTIKDCPNLTGLPEMVGVQRVILENTGIGDAEIAMLKFSGYKGKIIVK